MSDTSEAGPARSHTCPFCAHVLELEEDCDHCGATPQDRLAWLALTGLRLLQPNATVLHHLPGTALARRLHALLGPTYHPTLPPGVAPPIADFAFHLFDPASQAEALAPGSYQVIIIGAGLNDCGAAVPSVLEALVAALSRGGSLLFGGDVVDAQGGIANKDLAAVAMSGPAGASSFAGMVKRQFRRECRLRLGMGLTNAMADATAVPPHLLRRVTPQALFWIQA
jgi:hypothetical protein